MDNGETNRRTWSDRGLTPDEDAPAGAAREAGEEHDTGPAPGTEEVRGRVGGSKDSYTIGEVVERLRPEFPTLSVSKIRYLERRRLINLSRTRGGYRLFSGQDIELLKYILTLQDKEYLPLKVIKKRIEGGGARPRAGRPPLLPGALPPCAGGPRPARGRIAGGRGSGGRPHPDPGPLHRARRRPGRRAGGDV